MVMMMMMRAMLCLRVRMVPDKVCKQQEKAGWSPSLPPTGAALRLGNEFTVAEYMTYTLNKVK